jgi:hypothetical protein
VSLGDVFAGIDLRDVLTIILSIVAVASFLIAADRRTRSDTLDLDQLCQDKIEEATRRVTMMLQAEIADLRVSLADEQRQREHILRWMAMRGEGMEDFFGTLPDPDPEPIVQKRVLGLWVGYNGVKVDVSASREMRDLIANGYRFSAIVHRPITRNDVLEEVNSARPDILHFGGHSDEEFVYLMNDAGTEIDKVPSHFWATLARTQPSLGMVVLSSCESLDIARTMNRAGVPCVVGTRDKVSDDMIASLMSSFYLWLANGKKASEALQYAKISVPYNWAQTNDVVIQGDYP